MKKLKLTKNELKIQKDHLKRYNRYLPTLYIKKQQLQIEVRKTRQSLEQLQLEKTKILESMDPWVGLLATGPELAGLIQIDRIETRQENVAGIDLTTFQAIHFREEFYDLMETPFWVDPLVENLRVLLTLSGKIALLEEHEKILSRELLETAQRVNLFEKIKIPEAMEAIKKIRISLGDRQTAQVGWARLAKKKLLSGNRVSGGAP